MKLFLPGAAWLLRFSEDVDEEEIFEAFDNEYEDICLNLFDIGQKYGDLSTAREIMATLAARPVA